MLDYEDFLTAVEEWEDDTESIFPSHLMKHIETMYDKIEELEMSVEELNDEIVAINGEFEEYISQEIEE